MRSRSGHSGFEEMEALIYRLFAEKQFALALLALVAVAQLLSAQFLLLRLSPPRSQAASAPIARQRVDVQCADGGAKMLSGDAMSREATQGKVVVVHLGASADACLAQVTSGNPSELVVGVSADAPAAGR
ncbi:MAG: hypothetical protein ACJ79C_11820 [Myxococcales bacterium]